MIDSGLSVIQRKGWLWVDGCQRRDVGGIGWARIWDQDFGNATAHIRLFDDPDLVIWCQDFASFDDAFTYANIVADALIASNKG